MHGHDVVAYFTDGAAVLGSDTFAVAHDGGTYRFASRENLETFKADPRKFTPVYGGFCAYGVALGKKFDGDPRHWRIVDGKVYLNLNADIQAEWAKDVSGAIAKADANWTKIRSVAASKLTRPDRTGGRHPPVRPSTRQGDRHAPPAPAAFHA